MDNKPQTTKLEQAIDDLNSLIPMPDSCVVSYNFKEHNEYRKSVIRRFVDVVVEEAVDVARNG